MLGLEHATRSKIAAVGTRLPRRGHGKPRHGADGVLLGQRSVDQQHGPGFWPGCLAANLRSAFNAGNYPSQAGVDALFNPASGRPQTYVRAATPPRRAFLRRVGQHLYPEHRARRGRRRTWACPNNANFFVDRASGRVYGVS